MYNNTISIEYIRKHIKSFSKISVIFSLLIFIVFIFMPFMVSAQFSSVTAAKEYCIKALKNNDAESLIKSFSDPVEITLPESENSYSKAQAAMVMRKFLAANKIKSFAVKQSGKSTGGSEFIIGDMTSTNGKKYQVYFLITFVNNEAYLHLIEFELI